MRDAPAVALELGPPPSDSRQGGEVIERERLALDDAKVNLNLVEPNGMDRAVHGHQSGAGVCQAP
jgi:hypothetical protein